MAFFKTDKKNVDSGILYLLIIDIGEERVYKVGVTKRESITDRVCEIVTSFFHKYRYFPYVYPKRYRKVDQVYQKETKMHKVLDAYRYKSEHVFSGSTELFYGIELDTILKVYEDIQHNREVEPLIKE